MSKRIAFKFDSELDYQHAAITAVVDLFEGQNRELSDALYRKSWREGLLFEQTYTNHLSIGQTTMVKNLQQVQNSNRLFADAGLVSGNNFTIEMETGTGKTYVYLRTILELNKNYDFKKFIIVVPSIAILKGINKSLEMLQTHFKTLYDGLDIVKHAKLYDSKRLGVVDEFVESRDLQILIMNNQAFNKDQNLIKKGGESGRVRWDGLKAVRPVVIIDEPQKIEGTKKSKSKTLEAIEDLQPLFALRYSATHKNLYNQLYKLDSYDAYRQNLVKKIEVVTVEGNIDKNYPYIRYMALNKNLTARIKIFASVAGVGVKLKTFDVQKGMSLFELSGNLEQYRGKDVAENPHKEFGLKIADSGIVKIMFPAEDNYRTDDENIIRIQIRLTIRRHLQKQLDILDKGRDIKVLSLFFIDKVSNFRDSSQPDDRGAYARIFDEEYSSAIQNDQYKVLFNKYPDKFPNYRDILNVREGYFARDKNKQAVDVDGWDENTLNAKDKEDVLRGIDLILDKKDELISFDSSLAFIFAHSALREGWDNPNVFQLCTLKQGSSEIAKKQEIGRGLRLPVDSDGNRCFDPDINILTVVANENYETFAEQLQTDYKNEAGYYEEEVTFDVLYRTLEKSGVPKEKIDEGMVEILKQELLTNKIIKHNEKDNKLVIIPGANANTCSFQNELLQALTTHIQLNFGECMQDKGSRRIEIIDGDDVELRNGDSTFVSENEFCQILAALNERIRQRTIYCVNIDTDEFVVSCSKAIDNRLHEKLKATIFEVTTGVVQHDAVVGASVREQARNEEYELQFGDETQPRKSDFEIVNYLMQHTMLPRRALARIIGECQDSGLLQKQTLLDLALSIINEQLTEYKVKKIEYQKIDGYFYDQSAIFAVEDIFSEMLDKKRALAAHGRSVQKYIRVDSDGEYVFAKNLDNDNRVLLYTKLKKGGLQIDTPYGGYSPDWAIVYRINDKEAKLFFIIETKCDKKTADLTAVERAKIECATKHFAAIAPDVHYDWVDGYRRFQEVAQRYC
ncbi:MAG: DEAD/DEAH box helicase family protein [Bacillota bacterium]